MNKALKLLLLSGVCALGLSACATNGHVRTSGAVYHGTSGSGVYIAPGYRYGSSVYHPHYRSRLTRPYYTNPYWRYHNDRRLHERRMQERRWHQHNQWRQRSEHRNRPTPPVRPTPPARPNPPATRDRHQRAQPIPRRAIE